MFLPKSIPTYLGLFLDRLVNDIVVRCDLFLYRIIEILQAWTFLLQIDIAKTTIEQDFARVQAELESKLLIVYVGVSSQVEQCVVEVGQRFFEVTNEKVRDTFLEVCDSKILIEFDCFLIAFNLSTCQCTARKQE